MKFTATTLSVFLLTPLGLLLAACGDSSEGSAPASPSTEQVGAALSGVPGASNLPPVDPNTVVVTVNGAPITQGEVDAELEAMLFGGMQVEPARLAGLRQQFGAQAQKGLVDRTILEQAVVKNGVVVTPEELVAKWKEIDGQIPKEMDRAAFLQSKGMTQAEADERIGQHLRIEKLFAAHAPEGAVDDEALRAFYDKNILQFQTPEQVGARHILVSVPEGSTAEQKDAAKAKLEGFRAEIAEQGPEHFQVLAKEHSACPSKKDGGYLGMFGRGQMVPEFDEVAFKLEPGVVSEPVLTQFGWHILLVDKKQEAGTRTFEEVRDDLKARLEGETREKARTAYLETLRAEAKIEHPATSK
ncbi:MAG: peptidylprolyl isomerase [Planctomycetota bacterium]|nr:peptidylprolyl isomerase [Planctomycetota bacterium]